MRFQVLLIANGETFTTNLPETVLDEADAVAEGIRLRSALVSAGTRTFAVQVKDLEESITVYDFEQTVRPWQPNPLQPVAA